MARVSDGAGSTKRTGLGRVYRPVEAFSEGEEYMDIGCTNLMPQKG